MYKHNCNCCSWQPDYLNIISLVATEVGLHLCFHNICMDTCYYKTITVNVKKFHVYKILYISENKIIKKILWVINFCGVIFSCNCTVLQPPAQLPPMSASHVMNLTLSSSVSFWSSLVLQLGSTVRRRNLSNATRALAMIIMRDKDNENMCNTRY